MQRSPSIGVSAAALAPRAPGQTTPPTSPARTSSGWLPRSPSLGLKVASPLNTTPNEGWGKRAWEKDGALSPPPAPLFDAENVAPAAAERSPRAPASPGGPLRSLSGNALQLRRAASDGKNAAAAACVSPPAAAVPSPASSLPAPSTAEMPRGARLVRLGLAVSSPPKARAASDDDHGSAHLVAAALIAALLLGAGVAAMRPRRIVASTALVPWNAVVVADQARRLYPVGQAMLLPFASPHQLHCQMLALAALAPHAAWSHCAGAAALPALPALPSSAAAMQPGELALSAVAAVAAAAVMTADAYGKLAELASDYNASAGRDDTPSLAAIGTCALLFVTLALLRVLLKRSGRSEAPVEDFEEGGDEVSDDELAQDDDLVTPQSGIDEEYSGYTHSGYGGGDGIDSDVAAPLPEGELRDSWPLVSTPAVTRLLSFSRVASPVGSMRTSIGYGNAVQGLLASVQRRSRRLAGRDATVAGVGLPPPTRGSVQRMRGRQQR